MPLDFPGQSGAEQLHRRIELLAGVATDALHFNRPDELLLSAWNRISAETRADACWCYSVENDRLRLTFSAGIGEVIESQIQSPCFGRNVCGIAARDRVPIHSTNVQYSDDPSAAFLKSIGINAFSCYPLLSDNKLVGTVAFGSRQAPCFETEELELQRAVADQLAVALDRMLLIQELAANNKKLAAANAELGRANAELEQFAFSVSHDLREPIRHLNIYTEILRRRFVQQLDEDGRQCLQFVLSSAGRLEMLVADLLAYASVVHEDPVEVEIDANAVFGHVLRALEPMITQTSAIVRARSLPILRMNENHLEQLFHQLLQNAIKFRRSGIPPEIDVSFDRDNSGTVIRIQDNGIGIAPEHQNKIFGLFKRLDASLQQDGTGLGLAICQKIVERYQGQLWVESELGKGALFCFRLGEQTQVAASRAAAAQVYH